MRIAVNMLHLVPGETGGAEIYARRLLPALQAHDPSVELVVFAGGAAAREEWNAETVALRFDPRSRPRRVLAEQTLLPVAIRKVGADLVHNLFNTAPAVPGAPQVTTIHDVVFRRFPESGLLARGVETLVPLAARRSERVLTVSEASKGDIGHYLGVPPERIDVAPNGPGMREDLVGPTPLEIRQRFRLGDTRLVLTVAPTRPHKNVARLIEALARDRDAVLVVPGYATPYRSELEQTAARVGMEARVRFPGWVDDALLDGLYRAADCFCFPSLAEGFGLPVLEAMLRDAPVACSNTTSLPEVAGDAALLFDPTDVEAIAGAVRQILEDDALAGRLRAAGRERARLFSWEEAARLTLACYERVLA